MWISRFNFDSRGNFTGVQQGETKYTVDIPDHVNSLSLNINNIRTPQNPNAEYMKRLKDN